MTNEPTQGQSPEQLQAARRLSLRPSEPPAEVRGYTLQTFIGSGAYGEVWSGVDRTTGRQVAIKFYTRRSTVDLTLLAREVEKLAALAADRYVVQLLDVGWNAEPPYYVMDYIQHGSLEEHLEQQAKFSVEKAIDIFKECAQGMAHLHGKGILHCDLKPGNILLDQDHKPRLADFGQARLSHEQTPSLGTLFFMAPEQADLNAVPDARWDVYALGALLYRMLTGAPPFRDPQRIAELEGIAGIDDRLAAYRRSVAAAPKPNEHRKVPGMDRMLAEIIDRCIAVDPRRRFPNVHSLLQALRQREKSLAHRPLLVVGILVPVALLAGMSFFGWNLYRNALAQSEQTVLAKAAESNRWAAQLAARSAGEQIDDYFRAVESLAVDPQLVGLLKTAFTDANLARFRLAIADPRGNDDPELEPTRQEFLQNPARLALQDALHRLTQNTALPDAASWFISDPYGNQIASIFYEPSPSQTLGRNYAYRSYFSGLVDDLVRRTGENTVFDVDPDPNRRRHLTGSHLSGVFKSQATATWKIAFSTPIVESGQFLGLIAVTTEMGDFVEFENGPRQYAMLVDGRPSQYYGAVLEHPKLHATPQQPAPLPADAETRVDLQQLAEGGMLFVDPLVAAAGTPARAGARMVAGKAEVQRTSRRINGATTERPGTGLLVIAAEDYESIRQPVRDLATRLGRLILGVTLFVAAVVGVLSYWLWSTLRRSHRRFALGGSPTAESISGTPA